MHAPGALHADVTLQKGRNLETDDAVFHAPRFLGFHEVFVDRRRIADSLENGRFRDFVKAQALRRFHRQIQNLRQVPRDGFSFAVRVGRQVDFLGLAGRGRKFGDDFALARGHFVIGDETSIDVDAKPAFATGRKIADVALRGHDLEVIAEVTADRFAFFRGFNNY